MDMTTTDHTLLIVLAVLMSLFFLLMIVVAIGLVKVSMAIKRVVLKAEDVVDSVESAAEVFKDASGKMALYKVFRNIVKVTQKKGRK